MGCRMAEREIPVLPPRAPFYALPKAIAAFIAHSCDRTKMNVPAWAATYPPASVEDVRSEWEKQMSVKSQSPDNAYETEGK